MTDNLTEMKKCSHIHLALLRICDSKNGTVQRVSVSQLVVPLWDDTVGDLLPETPTEPERDFSTGVMT